MLKASISLWSADLANLESEIKRAEPYADRFHIDVADGHYAPVLLFFPDLVAAVRDKTTVPFEVHLICERPLEWIEPFGQAGANGVIFYPETVNEPDKLIAALNHRQIDLGVSLALNQSITALDPYWEALDLVCVLGTDIGVKGIQTVDERAYETIRALVKERERRGLRFEIEADGAIRRETVPKLREAGADLVVPGSLMFKNEMSEISAWLRGM